MEEGEVEPLVAFGKAEVVGVTGEVMDSEMLSPPTSMMLRRAMISSISHN